MSAATMRFFTLLYQDAGGHWSAFPVEADDDNFVGFGTTAAKAIEQLRADLTWIHERESFRSAPDLADGELSLFKINVRPEYVVDHRIYPGSDWIELPVHCVSGTTHSGMRFASLPLLGVRFHFLNHAELKGLVHRYVQLRVKGATARDIALLLPPPNVKLEQFVIRVRERERRPELQDLYPALTAVAEPLGERAVRKQFGAAWERAELVRHLAQKLHDEKASVLLIGEGGVGKTTILVEAAKECERRFKEKAKEDEETDNMARKFWLTSAGRLIAGMKYLGQWEQRLEKILDELHEMSGYLCVDRLLDLVRLGGIGPADSIAAFLIPYLQRGECRVVSEVTPSELDACRRLLPGFADLFPCVHVPPLDRNQVLNVLDRVAERNTQNLHIEIGKHVNDRVERLHRRFLPYQVLPGPAVGFLNDLCDRHARKKTGQALSADEVVARFVARTGMPEWLMRDEVPLDREALLSDLRSQVIGQDSAVEEAARVVMTFKAGLNDPNRPIGVLLFCGPTGVGKTELARALSRVLFGYGEPERATERDRLIRLDMSEYSGFDAVERLLGPPHGEPGVLIRKLRSQPFCVLLLDEIEKASPDVFDLLLNVLDEGRLTDRFGRTTIFRSAAIIMTSNLGPDENRSLGLVPGGPRPYEDVARSFFRPEFFNRLDGVVSFAALTPETIDAITRKELEQIGRREGMTRQGLRLHWDDRLVRWLARTGFDARFGARPLQRVLERQVVAPLARYLLQCEPQTRDIRVSIDENEKIAFVTR